MAGHFNTPELLSSSIVCCRVWTVTKFQSVAGTVTKIRTKKLEIFNRILSRVGTSFAADATHSTQVSVAGFRQRKVAGKRQRVDIASLVSL